MKLFKILGIGLITFFLSFIIIFFSLEIYKHTVSDNLFRAGKPYDLVIKHARIIDGTEKKIYRGEIGIRDDKIITIGNNLDTEGAIIFDAAGYTVAPQKVKWPLNLNWIERDLISSVLKYPAERLIIKEASDPNWVGKTVKALIAEGKISEEKVLQDLHARVLIIPENKDLVIKDIVTGFNWLTGWRADILQKKIGKIKEGYPANMIVFNHRKIKEDELLKLLKQEKLPPVDFIIKGSKVQSTKTDS